MSKYIDKTTFDIVENVFDVDDDIANSISILNKKGYYTQYSCSGHVKDPRLYEKYIIDKNNQEICIDSYIVEENTKEYTVLKPYTYTQIYIKFIEDYKFKNLPKEFSKEDRIIYKTIKFYNDQGKKKSSVIEREIKESNNHLFEWAQDLPNLNNI